LGLTYGWIELAQQYGEQNMRRHMWDSMVRVHGIAEKELPKLNREQILARMARAARERNIRACYARLLLRPQKDLLKYNADYLAELTQRLRGAGLTTGKASPYPAWNTAPWMFLLLGLGIAAGATLLAGRLLPLGGFGRIVVFLLFLILLAICKWIINKPVEPVLIRQAWSLLAGLTFPSLGLILAWQKMAAGVKSSELSVQSKEEAKALNSQLSTLNFGRVITAIGLVIEVSIFSFIGGLFIVGMLSETRFIVGAEQFRGVKLLLVTPFLLLTAAMAAGLTRPLVRVREWKKQVNGALRAFVGQPLLVGESILLLVILGALGILLLRSGNISSAAPAIEHQARAWLESSFWVRPRTKEFLLGHPALFIAALIWLTKRPLACGFGPGQQRLIPALLLVAALGQASIANTFSHLHTPLSISLLRTINGVWLGILVGIIFMIVWLLVRRLLIPAAEVTTTADSEP
ncbi:MAG: hypothetical protein GTO55_03045, partial [Armatimonadetes bacterium]|nr:hypothetical protein [Armatimonadota bacterium]NIM23252.1 hypothetical protein [Armatimonadota bacterium]NIM67120.1 hypothetical protein [Armatimonadota bacterium]NIM75647.1 hypothetical protein [Armatimonadota bacterium]NIN05309.1 hypothetical protein [Armatimonadota bacterium]